MTHAPPSPKRRSRRSERESSATLPELAIARTAQRQWATSSSRHRRAALRAFRSVLAAEGRPYAAASGDRQAEVLSAELLPLADACKFLERNAARCLKTRKLGRRGRPLWLRGVGSRVERVPFGAVLIVAPTNYPLLLPGVAALQAIAAGNAVVIKPGHGGRRAAAALEAWAAGAGLPSGLLQVLGESRDEGRRAVNAGFDKIVFTGSEESGREVLTAAAARIIPTTVELSGCDALFVLPGADLDRSARAIAFGLTFNASRTCIAPRRLYLHRSIKDELLTRLLPLLEGSPAVDLDSRTRHRLEATLEGARLLCGGFDDSDRFAPTIADGVSPNHPLAEADLFAPVATVFVFDDAPTAVEDSNRCRFGLGASIFGPEEEAARFARALEVGGVTINDLIVPTADPRLPFGGRGRSGFGVTRGVEGLLEMTRPKAVSVRRGKSLPHLEDPNPSDADLLAAFLETSHSPGISGRIAGLKSLIRAIRTRGRTTKPNASK